MKAGSFAARRGTDRGFASCETHQDTVGAELPHIANHQPDGQLSQEKVRKLITLRTRTQLKNCVAVTGEVPINHANANTCNIHPVLAAIDRQERIHGEPSRLTRKDPRRVSKNQGELFVVHQRVLQRRSADVHSLCQSGTLGIRDRVSRSMRVDIDEHEFGRDERAQRQANLPCAGTQFKNPTARAVGQQLRAPRCLCECPEARPQEPIVKPDIELSEPHRLAHRGVRSCAVTWRGATAQGVPQEQPLHAPPLPLRKLLILLDEVSVGPGCEKGSSNSLAQVNDDQS